MSIEPAKELPLYPQFNNPWLYLALTFKIRYGTASAIPLEEAARVRAQATACRIRQGLFNRWPDGHGGMTSHDELIGMAYLSQDLARELALYLIMMGGIYCNKPETITTPIQENIELNVYRFYWFRPFLHARAGFKLNLFDRILFSVSLILDAIAMKYPPMNRGGQTISADAGGRARIWLMIETMQNLFLCNYAVKFWRYRMNRLGDSPRAAIAGELPPALAEIKTGNLNSF